MNDFTEAPVNPFYRSSIITTVREKELERSCTDINCLLLTLLIIISAFLFSVWYSPQSNPLHNHPLDITHKSCKHPYKYLYMPFPNSDQSVCVTSCPRNSGYFLKCQTNSYFPKCPYSSSGLVVDEARGICHVIGSRVKTGSYIKTSLNLAIQYEDIIVKSSVLAGIISILVILLVFLIPEVMAYLCIALFDVILIALSLFGFYRYFNSQTFFGKYLPIRFKSSGALLITSIILFVVGTLSLFSICCKTLKSKQVLGIITIIRLSRIYIFNNLYVPLVICLLNALSIGFFYLTAYYLNICLGMVTLNKGNHEPHNQLQITVPGKIFATIIFIQFIWFHGFINSLSLWILQVLTTFWYYNPVDRLHGLSSFFSTIRLTCIHLGTVSLGSYYSYYSQNLTNLITNVQKDCNYYLFNYFCCFHNCCCRYLHPYSLTQTALKSLPFWMANVEFYHIRLRMREHFKTLYMVGYLFTRATKNLVVFVSLLLCYWWLLTANSNVFRSVQNIVPMLVMGWFLIVQIATPWMSLAGLVADTIVINYFMENEYNFIHEIIDQPLKPHQKVQMLLQPYDISF